MITIDTLELQLTIEGNVFNYLPLSYPLPKPIARLTSGDSILKMNKAVKLQHFVTNDLDFEVTCSSQNNDLIDNKYINEVFPIERIEVYHIRNNSIANYKKCKNLKILFYTLRREIRREDRLAISVYIENAEYIIYSITIE